MRKAMISGSFDPITKGHEWMIQEASSMFDEVVIVLAVNPTKKGYFTLQEREQMLKDFVSTSGLTNLKVELVENQYIASFAKLESITYLVRGVRSVQDYEYEKTMARMNKKINPLAKTIILMPPDEIADVSSSLVKSLVGFTGWHKQVSALVNKNVYSMFMKKQTENFLKERWDYFEGDADMFEFIMKKHTESQRFYHNTAHLVSLFKNLDLLDLPKHKKAFLSMMIFFHDLEYNPMAKDNEEKSAQAWLNFASGFTNHLSDLGSEIILATKNHATAPSKELLDLFLDLDLSILGASPSEFEEYEDNIRLEYGFVPDSIYEVERAKIMKTLKGQYRTEIANKLWLKNRDKNLSRY